MDTSNLAAALQQMDLNLNPEQQQLCLDYLAYLQKWNKAINLTAVPDSEMFTHHLLDSLSIVPFINGPRILDIGSGGGLPGIPVAIARPDCHVTLLDSRSKKTNFLTQACYNLKLDNTRVIQKRLAEVYADAEFDDMIVRAVGSLESLLPDCRRLADKAARLLYMTGACPDQELLPEGSETIQLHVPGLNAKRHLVIVKLN